MDRIDTLRVFACVAECASFTNAAAQLHIPRSSVSVAIQDLERQLGAKLLNRTTRKVWLTDDGRVFHERCRRLLADYEEAETLFRPDRVPPRGRLRVTIPSRIMRLIVAPALPDFLARYPEIELEMNVTDRFVDLLDAGIDCALRVGHRSDSNLLVQPIGEVSLVSCASPAYLARRGVPRTADDLRHHDAIGYASPDTGTIAPWECVTSAGIELIDMARPVTVNDAEAYIACCIAGLGLIQVPAYDVRGHVEAGELVEVMSDARPEPMPIAFLYAPRSHLSRRLKVFMDWVAGVFEKQLGRARV